VRALLKYSTLIQKALIRHWLKIQGFTVPEAKRLDSILSHVLRAKEEASPLVQWSGCEVRRYRDDLYALKSLSTLCTELRWDGLSPIVFNEYLVMPVMVEKYLASKANLTFIIRSRRGGERFWHGKQRLDLKTYWQTKGVPPWERERRPLIYLDSELILVPDVEFASSFT
jgi:tRNA(Ile)-lysidine synthase